MLTFTFLISLIWFTRKINSPFFPLFLYLKLHLPDIPSLSPFFLFRPIIISGLIIWAFLFIFLLTIFFQLLFFISSLRSFLHVCFLFSFSFLQFLYFLPRIYLNVHLSPFSLKSVPKNSLMLYICCTAAVHLLYICCNSVCYVV